MCLNPRVSKAGLAWLVTISCSLPSQVHCQQRNVLSSETSSCLLWCFDKSQECWYQVKGTGDNIWFVLCPPLELPTLLVPRRWSYDRNNLSWWDKYLREKLWILTQKDSWMCCVYFCRHSPPLFYPSPQIKKDSHSHQYLAGRVTFLVVLWNDLRHLLLVQSP